MSDIRDASKAIIEAVADDPAIAELLRNVIRVQQAGATIHEFEDAPGQFGILETGASKILGENP